MTTITNNHLSVTNNPLSTSLLVNIPPNQDIYDQSFNSEIKFTDGYDWYITESHIIVDSSGIWNITLPQVVKISGQPDIIIRPGHYPINEILKAININNNLLEYISVGENAFRVKNISNQSIIVSIQLQSILGLNTPTFSPFSIAPNPIDVPNGKEIMLVYCNIADENVPGLSVPIGTIIIKEPLGTTQHSSTTNRLIKLGDKKSLHNIRWTLKDKYNNPFRPSNGISVHLVFRGLKKP